MKVNVMLSRDLYSYIINNFRAGNTGTTWRRFHQHQHFYTNMYSNNPHPHNTQIEPFMLCFYYERPPANTNHLWLLKTFYFTVFLPRYQIMWYKIHWISLYIYRQLKSSSTTFFLIVFYFNRVLDLMLES